MHDEHHAGRDLVRNAASFESHLGADRARVSSRSSVQTMYARERAGTTLLGEHTRSDVSINSSVTAYPLVGAASRTFSSWSSPGKFGSTTKYNSYRPEVE